MTVEPRTKKLDAQSTRDDRPGAALPAMTIQCRYRLVASIQKQGNAPDECEDRAICAEDCFAVADGASVGIRSGAWAELLLEWFRDHSHRSNYLEELTHAAVRFRRETLSLVRTTIELDLLDKGTYATLAGVRLRPESGHASVMVVGDSCVMVCPEGHAPSFLPPFTADDLRRRPVLLGTRMSADNTLIDTSYNDTVLREHGFYRDLPLLAGTTTIMLFTDAISKWVLDQAATGSSLTHCWDTLAGLHDDVAFEEWVGSEREAGRMCNDDCILVIVDVQADASPRLETRIRFLARQLWHLRRDLRITGTAEADWLLAEARVLDSPQYLHLIEAFVRSAARALASTRAASNFDNWVDAQSMLEAALCATDDTEEADRPPVSSSQRNT